MRFARIFIFLVVTLSALPASAVSMWTQLDSHNIDSHQRLTFTVKAEKIKAKKTYVQLVRFRVTVQPKGATLSPLLEAHLTVLDGEKLIVSCPVAETRGKQEVAYEFKVSSNYLATSKFTFGNMAGSKELPMPAGDFYWFYLKDFVSEK